MIAWGILLYSQPSLPLSPFIYSTDSLLYLGEYSYSVKINTRSSSLSGEMHLFDVPGYLYAYNPVTEVVITYDKKNLLAVNNKKGQLTFFFVLSDILISSREVKILYLVKEGTAEVLFTKKE